MKELTDRNWYNQQTDDFKIDFMRIRNRDYPEYSSLSTTEFMAQFETIWREDKKKNQCWPIKRTTKI
jgi:hypothetical protein